MLFRLIFKHCTMVSPFILPCLPFSLTDEQIGEKSLKRCRWIVWLLFITSCKLMANCTCMCLIASSVKIITNHVTIVDRFKLDRMVSCWDLFLGCDMPIKLVLSSEYDDSLEDLFIMYEFTSRTSYKIRM